MLGREKQKSKNSWGGRARGGVAVISLQSLVHLKNHSLDPFLLFKYLTSAALQSRSPDQQYQQTCSTAHSTGPTPDLLHQKLWEGGGEWGGGQQSVL